MKTAVTPYRFSLRLPPEDGPAISALARDAGQAINDVLVVAIHKGLPLARQALCRDTGRITAVEPLPDAVLAKIYAEPDADEEGTRQFMAAQKFGGED